MVIEAAVLRKVAWAAAVAGLVVGGGPCWAQDYPKATPRPKPSPTLRTPKASPSPPGQASPLAPPSPAASPSQVQVVSAKRLSSLADPESDKPWVPGSSGAMFAVVKVRLEPDWLRAHAQGSPAFKYGSEDLRLLDGDGQFLCSAEGFKVGGKLSLGKFQTSVDNLSEAYEAEFVFVVSPKPNVPSYGRWAHADNFMGHRGPVKLQMCRTAPVVVPIPGDRHDR